ncbi:hypothetical protein JAB4_059730 (plasmid) [Janthinobacterium sp. HH102]|uniref:hypothetical protein n=1 Tax=Janthinobacterium sp. HH102 TaxID=1537274 RepID=UPI0008739ADB|nr:hypothetical protein [Janthinobacterium sp. HH102]QOU76473.1 hypothetical protein JAB4_059730 [Janthinobacterium sp. HH102]
MQFGFSNPFLAFLGAVVVAAVVVCIFFPSEVQNFLKRLDAKSEKNIKKQSDEMLAEMDRNVAERKAKHDH